MRHVRHYTRKTCGKWRVIEGHRRCCGFLKGHDGDCSWQKKLKDVRTVMRDGSKVGQ